MGIPRYYTNLFVILQENQKSLTMIMNQSVQYLGIPLHFISFPTVYYIYNVVNNIKVVLAVFVFVFL